jgi:hypothetical protein
VRQSKVAAADERASDTCFALAHAHVCQKVVAVHQRSVTHKQLQLRLVPAACGQAALAEKRREQLLPCGYAL